MQQSEKKTSPGAGFYWVMIFAIILVTVSTILKTGSESKYEKDLEKVTVVYAIKNLKPGTIIKEEMIEEKQVFGYLTSSSMRMRANDLIGRKLNNAKNKGTVFSREIVGLSNRTVEVTLDDSNWKKLVQLAKKKKTNKAKMVKNWINAALNEKRKI